MKKGVLLAGVLAVFIAFVLLANLACAVEGASGAIKEGAQNILNEVKSAPSEPLEKPVVIPSGLDVAAKVFLGVTSPVRIDILIISIMVFILLFIVVANALRIIPNPETGTGNLFGKSITIIPIAFIVTGLMGFGGVINFISKELIGFGNLFNFLGRLDPGAIIFALVLMFALFSVLSRVMSMLKSMRRAEELEKAKAEGAEIGAKLGFLSSMREMFNFTRGKR